jgi:hypothetical protein
MSAEPREYRIVREHGGLRDKLAKLDAANPRDYQLPASAYRLMQAEDLLRETGYVRQDDGTWQPPSLRQVPRKPQATRSRNALGTSTSEPIRAWSRNPRWPVGLRADPNRCGMTSRVDGQRSTTTKCCQSP